jgi:hypothetical protein
MKSPTINGVCGTREQDVGQKSDETRLAGTKTLDLSGQLNLKRFH